MAVDFGLLQQPNIAGTAIQALGQGRQVGMEDARRRVLSGYGEDRNGTISQLMAIDPATAINLQQANRQEKNDVNTGQEHDQAAIAAGHRTIAGLLGVIQRQTQDPNERRAMALHVVQQLGSQMDPAQAQQLLQEAQSFDYSDNGIANYVATFNPDTGADNVTVGGDIVNRRTGRLVYHSDHPIITPFGIITPGPGGGGGAPGGAPAGIQAVTPAAGTDGQGTTSAPPPVSVASHNPVSFQAPVNGRVSSGFGARTAPMRGASTNHRGEDLAVPDGTSVQAAADGEVISAGPEGNLGNTVRVRHADGSVSIYGHLGSAGVQVGSHVTQGQEIGRSGHSGLATGPHVHFEVLGADGQPVDPSTLISGHPAGATPAPPPAPDQSAQPADATDLGGGYTLRQMETPAQRSADRHTRVMEDIARQNLEIARGHLQVAQASERRQGAAANDAPTLTHDDLVTIAENVAAGGDWPPLGFGRQAANLRAQILHEVTSITHARGQDGGDIAANRAAYQGNRAALRTTSTQEATTARAERTAENSAQIVLDLAGRGGGPTNAPVLNRWIQAGRRDLGGDPDVTAFNNALGTLGDEYAIVMGGGNQASTDSSRRTAYERFNAAGSPAQIQTTIALMRREMAGRMRAYADTRTEEMSRLRGPGHAAPAPAGGGRVRTWNPTLNGGRGGFQ